MKQRSSLAAASMGLVLSIAVSSCTGGPPVHDDPSGGPLDGSQYADGPDTDDAQTLELITELGKIRRKNKQVLPAWHMDFGRFVFYATDVAAAERLFSKTGAVDRIEIIPTTVSIADQNLILKQVNAVIAANGIAPAMVGPDLESYPLLVVRIPSNISDSIVDQIERLQTGEIPIRVIRSDEEADAHLS